MPKRYIRIVKEHLRVVISKFAANEIENLVMPIFPEMTWREIQKELNMGEKHLTAEYAHTLIEAIIIKCKLRNEDIKTRILALQTIEVSRHSNKKIWYGLSLIRINKEVRDSKYEKVQAQIVERLGSENIHVEGNILEYEGVLYICIREKVNSRTMVNCSPMYFALSLEHGYLFCTKKTISRNYLCPIIESLGLENSSSIDIMGKDLRSLVQLLRNEKQTTFQPAPRGETYSVEDPEFDDPEGTDYTESLHRQEYAASCSSSDQPNLQSLIIDVPEQRWKHKAVSAKLLDKIQFQCEIRSPNVPEFLVKLTEANVLTPPLPAYIRNVMSFRKRTARIEDDELSDDEDE